ncbi:hypothetical protein ACP70R_032621 [Stipagrostis hirtigluma subsp. patula]
MVLEAVEKSDNQMVERCEMLHLSSAFSLKRCILDIDVQGARSVRVSSLEAILIFVCPPSLRNWRSGFGHETEEQIQKRLRNARAELDQSNSPGLFYHLLVNDDLETCYENLKKLL